MSNYDNKSVGDEIRLLDLSSSATDAKKRVESKICAAEQSQTQQEQENSLFYSNFIINNQKQSLVTTLNSSNPNKYRNTRKANKKLEVIYNSH